MQRSLRRFTLHAAAMTAAMIIGMVVIFPLWEALVRGRADHLLMRLQYHELAMVTAMTLPMGAYMIAQRRRLIHVAEMVATMYAGSVLLLALSWAGVVKPSVSMMLVHPLMLTSMLALMVVRQADCLRTPRLTDRRPGSATVVASVPHDTRARAVQKG